MMERVKLLLQKVVNLIFVMGAEYLFCVMEKQLTIKKEYSLSLNLQKVILTLQNTLPKPLLKKRHKKIVQLDCVNV